MRIGVDLRPMTQGVQSGVAQYTSNLLEHLIATGTNHEFVLWHNSLRASPRLNQSWLKAGNARLIRTNISNRLLDAGLLLFSRPSVERILGPMDLFFSPHFFLIATHAATPRVITVHDLSFLRYPEFFDLRQRFWHARIVAKRQLKRAAHLIAVSESTARDLTNLVAIPRPQISVIKSGLATVFFDTVTETAKRRVAKKYGLKPPYLLFLGTIEPRKNVEGLIEAFNLMDRTRGPARLLKCVIAGPRGWLCDEIRKRALVSPRSSLIHFTGFIDDQDRPALYALASVFIFPSFFEGFGFPVLEAMACGTPVVTSDRSSLPEIADRHALLIDPHRPHEIARAIEMIMGDTAFRVKLTQGARNWAGNFTWAKTAQETLRLFERIAGS